MLEIIRRFEEGQTGIPDVLVDFFNVAKAIKAEQGAHVELGMDERAFSILRIMEAIAPDMDHPTLQAAAIDVGAIYAAAQRQQPDWYIMDGYRRELRSQVRRILGEHGVAEARAIRDAVEEFAVHAYAGKA